jgi:diaminopimelate decarboxylase
LGGAIEAVKSLMELAIEANNTLELNGIERKITALDIGGGLSPEILGENQESNMRSYARAITENCPEIVNFKLITEFGQWCYFYTGYAYSRVEYSLIRGDKKIIFIHLGADFLMRDAYSKPRGLSFLTFDIKGELKTTTSSLFDIAGPLCFAGDYVTKNQLLQDPEEGDWLGLVNTGSNSIGLWSRHCSRMVPKVLGSNMNANALEVLSERFNPFA